MEGPEDERVAAMRSGNGRPGACSRAGEWAEVAGAVNTIPLLVHTSKGSVHACRPTCLCNACARTNMLSTPMASTRKGMTSMMMSVDQRPRALTYWM